VTYDQIRAGISKLDTWDADRDHAVAMIEPHLVYGGNVLDFGCGVGRIMKPLAAKHTRTRFYGVDLDEDALFYARFQARDNEIYGEWPEVRSAFSVITFQHMADWQVIEVIEMVYPARFRFQFAIGEIQMPLNYQRSPEVVEAWCEKAGYRVKIEDDPLYPTWRWVTAR
jgi:SAM-dependent methyltransferase